MELTEVNKRIQEYIDYRYNGNRTQFGNVLGWSANYTYKILRGESIGLSPITDILGTFPDINARWLMFGTGTMVEAPSKRIFSAIEELLQIEQYLSVMSIEELRKVECGDYNYTSEQRTNWQSKLNAKRAKLQAEIDKALKC